MTTHKASCSCGSLTLEATRDPDITIACSCRACQKRTGSSFATVGYFPKDAVSVRGERKSWVRAAESGRIVENFFCPTCGGTVFWTLDFRPNHVGVLIGTLDTLKPEPVRAVWTEEKLPWVQFPDTWETLPKGSPGS